MGLNVTNFKATKSLKKKSFDSFRLTEIVPSTQTVSQNIKNSFIKNSGSTEDKKNCLDTIEKDSALQKGAGSVASSKPNAEILYQTMAPALTEPLSPTEKLSSGSKQAVAGAANSNPTVTTRYNRKSDTNANSSVRTTNSNKQTTSTAITAATVREKRIRNNTPVRGKRISSDTVKSVERKSISSPSPVQAEESFDKKRKVNNKASRNDQMGLNSTVLKKNNNNYNNSNKITIGKEASNVKKEDSNEQLLADLTGDIDERASKKHDLPNRKSLTSNSNLTKNFSKQSPNGSKSTVDGDGVKAKQQPTQTCRVAARLQKKREERESKKIAAENALYSNSLLSKSEEFPKSSITKKTLEIIAVEDLPPNSSDSTMSASEAEDVIEERLSKLDGGNGASNCASAVIGNVATKVAIVAEDSTNNISSSPAAYIPTTTTQEQVPELPQVEHVPLITTTGMVQTPQNSLTVQGHSSLLYNVGSNNMSTNFLKETATGELEDHDFEEVFKALNGLGNSTAAGDIDLNALIGEVYTALNCGEVNTVAPQQVLLTPTSQNVAIKQLSLKDMQAEVIKQQQLMERKIDTLLKRTRTLQARHMCKHTSEEIAGLFEHAARKNIANFLNTNNATKQEDKANEIKVEVDSDNANVSVSQKDCWEEECKQPVTAAQVSVLMQKIDAVANAQQLSFSPKSNNMISQAQLQPKKGRRPMAITATTESSTKPATTTLSTDATTDIGEKFKDDVVIPPFDEHVSEELSQISGMLHTQLREIQYDFDTDATESSSACESTDELVMYNNEIQQPLDIQHRAAWRYSCQRAAIAARISWLLAQITDLDIKESHHDDLYQEIVRAKGAVVCEDKEDLSTVKDEVSTAPSLSTVTSVNGFKGDVTTLTNSIVTSKAYKDDDDSNALPGACRTRGFNATLFRKRKLLQTANLHTISKKAARTSTIKCGCFWPLTPCALCTGRSDPTAPRDLPDTMPMAERISLLIPTHHPVLSFAEDADTSIHLEAIARMPEWQTRAMRSQVKSIVKSVRKAERDATNAANNHLSKKLSYDHMKRRYVKRINRTNIDRRAGLSGSSSHTGGDGLSNSEGVTGLSSQRLERVGNESMKNSAPLNNNNNTINSNYIHQTSDYQQERFDRFNPRRAHSSLISTHNTSSRNKFRKSSASLNPAYSSTNYNNVTSRYSNNNRRYNGNMADSNFLVVNDGWDKLVPRSRTSSPTHAGSSNYHKYERSTERKSRTSYDIDNIVIPYSVAATTRVEILPYKEIPTPKWRVIKKGAKVKNEEVSTEEQDANKSSDCVNSNNIGSTNGLKDGITVANGDDLTVKLDKEVANIEDFKSEEKLEECKTAAKSAVSDVLVEKPKEDTKASEQQNYYQQPAEKKMKMNFESVADVIADPAFESGKEFIDSIDEEGFEEEDISDETTFLRHERALDEERRKFQTYLKFPWSTRSRANRRSDSRNESSGANTPDPASPAPQTPLIGGGDQESIPSPLATTSAQHPLDSIPESSENVTAKSTPLSVTSIYSTNKRYERRRTTSNKNREFERRSQSPDLRELVPPYEPLKFPLSEDTIKVLLNDMPPNYQHHDNSKNYKEDCFNATGIERNLNRDKPRRNRFRNNGATLTMSGSLDSEKSVASRTTVVVNITTITTTTTTITSKTDCDVIDKGQTIKNSDDADVDSKGANTSAAANGVGGNNSINVVNESINEETEDANTYDGYDDEDSESSDIDDIDNDADFYIKHADTDLDDLDDEHEDFDDSLTNRKIKLSAMYKNRRKPYQRPVINDGMETESDSSEAEPFLDDDPNDPEWKGAPLRERTTSERLRKKM